MSKLNTNLKVNKEGWVFISYDILEDYIEPSLKKVPFEFNDAENQIMINIGIDEKSLEKYEKSTVIQRRKFLYYEVIKTKIRKNEKQVKEIIDLLSEKLASLEDPHELPEILQNIEDAYSLEQYFCFYFNRSNYLNKFFNEIFDIELIEPIDGSLPKKIIFNFKSIDNITPRSINANIHQGTLLIHKTGPPKVIKHFMTKDYIIIKLFSLMDRHSNGLKNVYDILITCDEQVVNQIFRGKNYDNKNVFFGKYSKEHGIKSFYISKLRFEKFLKLDGDITLYIKEKQSETRKGFPFNDELYDKFLLNFDYYNLEKLREIKEKSNRGVSPYFSHIYDFLKNIKSKPFKYPKNYRDQIDFFLRNLNDLDFSVPIKREIFDVNVKVHFLDNMNILITRDENLEIDYASNPILDGLENNIKKGMDLFVNEYSILLMNKELFKIDDKFYKTIFYTLKNLKYSSALDLRPEFVKDCFYYFAILKNNVNLIKSYFLIKNNLILDTVAVVLGIQNAFRRHFSKEYTKPYFHLFFNSKFANFSDINLNTLDKIKKYCQDMIFIFEASQDLKLLQRELKDKFRTNIEFKSIVKNVERLVDKRLNAQKDFGEILEVIKKEIQVKKDPSKDVEEIKRILEQKLKGAFSEEQYIQSIKSIEGLLKSKMKPVIEYDIILKQINSLFKKKITTSKQVEKVIEYVNENLKNGFEDEDKFNSVVEKIRETYDFMFEHKRKYLEIIKRLEKKFKDLNNEKDIPKIQEYIEENLEEIFESSQERQSVFRQIDREFLNKTENPKELEDIIKLSAELVKIFINDTGWHSIIVASIFTGFLLALNKDKEITIGSVCKILNILPTSVSLHIKKLLSNYLENKRTAKFDNLKITDEETRQNLRLLLVKQLLESNIYMIFNVKDSKRLNNLIERFRLRIDFFNRHEQFKNSIEEVSKFLIDKYIKALISEIKQTKKIQNRDLKLSNLSDRLTFFNNFSNFRKYLNSLKSEIKEIFNETPEIYKSISFKK